MNSLTNYNRISSNKILMHEPNAPLFYPLQMSDNHIYDFLSFSRGRKVEHLLKMGYVNGLILLNTNKELCVTISNASKQSLFNTTPHPNNCQPCQFMHFFFFYVYKYDLHVKHKWTKNRHSPGIIILRECLVLN